MNAIIEITLGTGHQVETAAQQGLLPGELTGSPFSSLLQGQSPADTHFHPQSSTLETIYWHWSKHGNYNSLLLWSSQLEQETKKNKTTY